ncbi:MAG: hypothetical protein QOG49_1562 [Frankiaceae bacterium]|jgi:hypothetical protein|nr:hypothetical protein [Frankiaceae bacterium]
MTQPPEPPPSPYAAPQPGRPPYGQNPHGQNPYGHHQWVQTQWGQPAPQQGWATPPGWSAPPPSSGGSRWKLIVAAVAFLVVAGCGALVVKGFGAVNDARDQASAYARALVAGRYYDAYAMHCAEDRSQQTAEEFARDYDEAYAGYTIESVNVRNVNGVTSGDLRLRLRRLGGGLDQRLYVPLRRENGKWKPCDSA